MNGHHDLERRLADFYDAEAPRQAPDRVLHAALETIATTRQRRVLIRVPRRFQTMNTSARAAIAAAAVIAVGAVILAVVGPFRLSGTGPGAVASPSPSPSVSPSSSPSAIASPSPSPLGPLTGSFTSAVFGVSSSYPAGWKVQRATQLWTTKVSWACAQTCADVIYEKEADSPFFSLSSQPLAGKSGPEWIAATLADPGWEGTCPPVTEPVSIDGTNGTLASICPEGLLVALTSSADRGYAFVLYRVDDINDFKKILATVRLQPADAVNVMPSATPS
jgi:hypothetical protein